MYQHSYAGPNFPSLYGRGFIGPREVCKIWKAEVRQQRDYTQKAGLGSGPTAARTYCRPSAASWCWCGERAKSHPGPGVHCSVLRALADPAADLRHGAGTLEVQTGVSACIDSTWSSLSPVSHTIFYPLLSAHVEPQNQTQKQQYDMSFFTGSHSHGRSSP